MNHLFFCVVLSVFVDSMYSLPLSTISLTANRKNDEPTLISELKLVKLEL